MIPRMVSALASLDSQVVVFILGAGAWGFIAWLKHWLESLRESTNANTAKLDEAEGTGHDQTIRITDAIATMLQEMKDHRRRLEEHDAIIAEKASAINEIERTVGINGEHARLAIADFAAVKGEVRHLSDSFIKFGLMLEAHDKRTGETASKLDRLLDLFVRGEALARASR